MLNWNQHKPDEKGSRTIFMTVPASQDGEGPDRDSSTDTQPMPGVIQVRGLVPVLPSQLHTQELLFLSICMSPDSRVQSLEVQHAATKTGMDAEDLEHGTRSLSIPGCNELAHQKLLIPGSCR